MRIGILGGTFNPIHLGHLAIADEARKQLSLDEVIFVPAARPWMKDERSLAPFEHRLAMTRLAIKGNKYFSASSVDSTRPGPSYAADTVADIRKEKGSTCEAFFIMGMDSLVDLPSWRKTDILLSLCRLAVVTRPGYKKAPALRLVTAAIPNAEQRIDFVETAEIDTSATEIRARLAKGQSIKGLVPKAVESYIAKHGLYV